MTTANKNIYTLDKNWKETEIIKQMHLVEGIWGTILFFLLL